MDSDFDQLTQPIVKDNCARLNEKYIKSVIENQTASS